MGRIVTSERRGLMLIFLAPSGAGKTTITRGLLSEDDRVSLSVSATTRASRPGEEHGVHYFFTDRESFLRDVRANRFLEHAEVFGHLYGTPRAPVEAALGQGRDVLFDIDWQGARQVTARARGDAVSVFLLPPDAGVLEDRLRRRGRDSEAEIARRMSGFAGEVGHWDEADYVLINDDLDRVMDEVRAIVKAERLKRVRQTGLAGIVERFLEPSGAPS